MSVNFNRYGDPPSRDECVVKDPPPGLIRKTSVSNLTGFYHASEGLMGKPLAPHAIVRQLFQHYGFDTEPIAVQVPGYGLFLLSGGAWGGWEYLPSRP